MHARYTHIPPPIVTPSWQTFQEEVQSTVNRIHRSRQFAVAGAATKLHDVTIEAEYINAAVCTDVNWPRKYNQCNVTLHGAIVTYIQERALIVFNGSVSLEEGVEVGDMQTYEDELTERLLRWLMVCIDMPGLYDWPVDLSRDVSST